MTIWRTADPEAALTDPDEAVPPRETTAADAGDAVNFVAFEPDWLPDDCRVAAVTRRPERPPAAPTA